MVVPMVFETEVDLANDLVGISGGKMKSSKRAPK
jgi:hypothetical protein